MVKSIMTIQPFKYSEKELQLFKLFNVLDWAYAPSMPPILIYRNLAIECFKKDDFYSLKSKAVRKCLIALEQSTTLRLTPEFDNLIQLEEWDE